MGVLVEHKPPFRSCSTSPVQPAVSSGFLRVAAGRFRLVCMTVPETRYARSGDVVIAYQVVGEGPFDVVFVPGTVSHVEVYWEAGGVAALLRGGAAHARVLL